MKSINQASNIQAARPKIVFITSVFDQTQKDFYEAMYSLLGDGFSLVVKHPKGYVPSSTRKINQTAYSMDYISSPEECKKKIAQADALMLAQPSLDEYKQYLGAKVMIKVGEKFYKTPAETLVERLRRRVSCYLHYGRFEKFAPLYFGIGHYAVEDLKKYRLFKGRAYRFAYFSSLKNKIREGDTAYTTPIRLCWIGRLKTWKRPALAIAFCRQARLAGLDARLTIYGDRSEEYETIKQLIVQSGLTDAVCVRDEALHDRVYDEIRNYHFCLATSDSSEGWGLTIEDAMSQGVPAIASRCSGSAPELIVDGANGFLFDTEEDFAELIEKLKNLQHTQYQKLSQNCVKFIRDDFDVNCAAERVVEIVNGCLNGEPVSYPSGMLGSIY